MEELDCAIFFYHWPVVKTVLLGHEFFFSIYHLLQVFFYDLV